MRDRLRLGEFRVIDYLVNSALVPIPVIRISIVDRQLSQNSETLVKVQSFFVNPLLVCL